MYIHFGLGPAILRTAVAKDKFLTDMPKKPLGHLQLYFRDKVKELKKAWNLDVFRFCSFLEELKENPFQKFATVGYRSQHGLFDLVWQILYTCCEVLRLILRATSQLFWYSDSLSRRRNQI